MCLFRIVHARGAIPNEMRPTQEEEERGRGGKEEEEEEEEEKEEEFGGKGVYDQQ